ncbi:MAG: hypothetical protein C0490_14655 [Marivirga sp.]|nr:hypothetical protein [Marivirga sp.]
MSFLSFTSQKTFTTSFSEQQTLDAIQGMLSSKSKILFFTIRHYFGHLKGQEFVFSTYNGYQTRLLVPMVKGKVTNDDRTVVDLKFQLPIIPTFFLLVLPMMFLPSFFTIDEMTINGVLREPTMNERIGWALFFYWCSGIIVLFKLHSTIAEITSGLQK